MNSKGTKKKNQVVNVNIFEQQEIIARAEEIKKNLKASTWHELETKGKFDKNEKLTFINDDMLILGCDVGRMRKKCYEDAKENAAFERCADVIKRHGLPATISEYIKASQDYLKIFIRI